MNIFDRIVKNGARIYKDISSSPLLCALITCMLAVASMIIVRILVGELFLMHRSRSSVNKIRKNYSFLQKIIFLPQWQQGLHARRFCRVLICVHHMRLILLLLSLSFAIVAYERPAIMPVVRLSSFLGILAFDIPIFFLHLFLEKYPFNKLKHEYKFKKYNNSKEMNKLF